ncbi:TonB-dependent receptor [Gemmatimonas aurantiaca]|nr:TonB-dependent receptor [Gemmatimonas aurantiaca]
MKNIRAIFCDRTWRPIALAIGIALFSPLVSYAGLTGKLAGEIIDAESGEPIVGARVEMIGAPYSAISDEDGEFFMLAIPAGVYTILISAPGYASLTKQNARVLLDLTTPLDAELMSITSEIADTIVVIAERPLVQKDQTGTRYTVTAEEIAYLPNSISLRDILVNMSGAVTDRDGSLHIRGGRTGEVTYIYDGIIVNDPVTRTVGMRIVPDFLEEVNLTSGGFPAEYGEAGSGVVNAVTREGKSFYTGSLKAYDGSTHQYDPTRGVFGPLSRSSNQALLANFSGPLTILGKDKATFFVAGEALRDGGYLPHNFSESFTFTGKLSFRPAPNVKLTANGAWYGADKKYYDHRDVNGISYDFNLDGLPITYEESKLLGLRSQITFSPTTTGSANLSYFKNDFKLAPEHLFDTYWDKWPGFVADSTGAYDASNGRIHIDNYDRLVAEYGYTGFTIGDDYAPRYTKKTTSYTSAKANLTHQIDKRNQFKFGGEFRSYDVFWDQKLFYNATPYGETYNHLPKYANLYAQHKLEYNDVIINAGLRFDHLASRVTYLKPRVGDQNAIVKDEFKSTPKSQISPRLGVSHPVAENTILRFNYGFFFQPPKFWTMFINTQSEINSGYPLVGNPDLLPEKTIAYELGLNHAIGNDLSLDVTTYFKDIENLIASRNLTPNSLTSVTGFINEDFSTVKGFDVSVTKRRSRYFYGSMRYSFMIAKGVAPNETYAYYNVITEEGEELPVTAYPLDFDQRHTLTLNADLRTRKDWRGKMFGVIPTSGAWGLNVIGRYGSGLPYSKYDSKTGQRVGGINAYRMPFTYTIDARINRDFHFGGSSKFLSLFVEVENVFNRQNVVNVYPVTGLADDDGVDFLGGGGLITQEQTDAYYRLITNDPQNYSPPRTIRTGIQFSF